MDQFINNIKSVPGVVGIAIFKDNGDLVAFDFPEAYDKNLLNLVGLKFQPLKEILPEDEGEIVYLCWEFENLLGFYYPVEGGWVNIISSDDIPMPALSLTMTAVTNKLPKSLAGAEAVNDRPAAVINIVPAEKIKDLEKIFSLYLGPATHVILKRAAHQLGYTPNNIPEEKLNDVIDIMVAKVPDNKKEEVISKVGKN